MFRQILLKPEIFVTKQNTNKIFAEKLRNEE